MTPKRYFISYRWRHRGSWNFDDKVVSEHPVMWLIDLRKNYGDGHEYSIVFWAEIPEDVYDAWPT